MKIRFAIVITIASLVAAPMDAQATYAATQQKYVAAMKSDLRSIATAEEAYFADNAHYYAGTISASEPLYGLSPSPGVTITVSVFDNGNQWKATASHANSPSKCTFELNNLTDPQARAVSIRCDPPPPSGEQTYATPRGDGTAEMDTGPKTIAIGTADSVRIRPGRSKSWPFDVHPPRTLCLVTGQVAALSGGDKKVIVLIMTEFAYQDWLKNRPARTYFESGERTEIPFDVRIEGEGRYRLVVWNPSATAAPKTVKLQQTQVACNQ
jgi:hypothetical protein